MKGAWESAAVGDSQAPGFIRDSHAALSPSDPALGFDGGAFLMKGKSVHQETVSDGSDSCGQNLKISAQVAYAAVRADEQAVALAAA